MNVRPFFWMGALALLAGPCVAEEDTLSVTGMVAKMVMLVDDGVEDEVAVVDNGAATSRIGVEGRRELGAGAWARFNMTMDISGNGSGTVGQPVDEPRDAGGPKQRLAYVALENDDVGVAAGFTETATDAVTRQDPTGVADVMAGNRVAFMGGGLGFRRADGSMNKADKDGSALTVGEMANAMDGPRANAVRVDIKGMPVVLVRASVTQGGQVAAGVFAKPVEVGEVTVKAGLGIEQPQAGVGKVSDYRVVGSVGVKHSSGVGAFAAAGQEMGVPDGSAGVPKMAYVKLAYVPNAWGMAVEQGWNSDNRVGLGASHTVQTRGVGMQYDLGHGVTLASGWRRFKAEVADGGEKLMPVNVMSAGMKVKF